MTEAEIKLRLPTAAAHAALVARLAHGKLGVLQSNQFFDTASGSLADKDCHLRLRREEDLDQGSRVCWVLTAKGPKRKGGAVASMAVRPEEETLVSAKDAEFIQAGTRNPLEYLPPTALIKTMSSAAGKDKPLLARPERFENVRVAAPITLETSAGPQHVTLEIDKTTFQWGGAREEQFEVECELAAELAAELAGPCELALVRLLCDVCGGDAHEFAPAKGKLSRMKAFVKAHTKEGSKEEKPREKANERAKETATGQGAAAAEAAEAAEAAQAAQAAEAAEVAGAPASMLSFGGQSGFEAWLRACPLPPATLGEYAVSRTQSGFDVRCLWHLPFSSSPAPKEEPPAPQKKKKPMSATAAGPKPAAQSERKGVTKAPAPAVTAPAAAAAGESSGVRSDSAETLAAVQALLGTARAATAGGATGGCGGSSSKTGTEAVADSTTTVEAVRGLIDAVQSAPAVVVPSSSSASGGRTDGRTDGDAATINFLRSTLAQMHGNASAAAAAVTAAGIPTPPPSPPLGVPLGLSCDANNRHLPRNDLVLDGVIDGVPLAGCATGETQLVRHQELQQYEQRRGQAQAPVRRELTDHELAVIASRWLERKPLPPTFDTEDGYTLLVRGEQPPTRTLPTGYLWAQTLGEVGLSALVPAGTRSRSIQCSFRRSSLHVALVSTSPSRVLLDCELLCPIVPDGCSWTLEGGGTDGEELTLQLLLEKATRGGFWRCVSPGHESVPIPSTWPIVGV